MKKRSRNKLIKSEDELFMADTKAAFLNRTTIFANSILFILLFLIIAGLIWAYFGKVNTETVAEGIVIPSARVKIIQSLDGGIVAELPVKEGKIVKKDQVLVKLDDTRYKADFREDYDKYLALLASTARLKAEVYDLPTVSFPKILYKASPSLVTQENNLFETERDSLKNEVALLQKSLYLANRVIAMYQPLLEKGIVSQVDYIRAQSNANDIKDRILEKVDRFREDASNNYNKENADLAITTEKLKSLRDKMDRTTITSPVNGIIKKLNVVTIGGVVTPGFDIMEVVPTGDTLLVEAHVRPKDIAFIKVGQPATVRFAAYDYTIFGSLDGTVEYISPDVIEPRTAAGAAGESQIYYQVNIRTKKSYLGSENNQLPILPGMTATVNIKTGQKRVLDYLLKPLLKAKEEALRER